MLPSTPSPDLLRALRRSALRSLAPTDFYAYQEYVHGYKPAPHIRQMVDFVEERIARGENGVVLAPRGSTKTTSLTTGYLGWKIATTPDIRVGLFSQKDKKAEAFSEAIKWTISESEAFKEIFGSLRGTTKWTSAEWVRKGSRWRGEKDRTMVTGGVNNSSAVSKRFDVIYCHAKGTLIFDGGEWMAVEDHPTARVRHGDGLAISVWGLPFPEVVTPEHRYWAMTPEGEPGWIEAERLDRATFIGAPIDMTVEAPRGIPQRVNYLQSSGKSGVQNDWRYEEIEQPEFADADWWWLLGLWWGDGHRAARMVGWTMSSEATTERLISILDRYGYPWHRIEREGCWQITMQSTRWAEWLTTWRTGNSMKQPPSWVERIDLRYQAALLRGYIDADGFVDEGQAEARITSVHIPGLLAARRMLARLGVPSTIRNGPGAVPTVIRGRMINSTQRFDLRFHLRYGATLGLPVARSTKWAVSRNRTFIEGGHLWSKVRGIEEVEDQEFVPIQTADHTYLTAFGRSHNCDDILDFDNTYTVDRREKTEDWFWRTMKPAQAAEGVSIIVVGTRWTEGDLYERLIETNKWPSLVIPAISQDDEGNDRSYWPEVWPLERLYAERDDIGWDNFNCAYQNDLSGNAEGVIFRREWFDYFDELPRDRRFLYTMGVDLASSERERADYTVRAVVAEDENHEHWVLGVYRTKIESGHKQFVKDGAAAFPQISKIIIETNQHQSTLVQDLLNETTLPVVGRKTDVDKRTRARAVAARYEAHRVHHHRSLKGSDYEAELTNFPKGHDDQIDAVGLAMDIRGVEGAMAVARPPMRDAYAPQEPVGSQIRFSTGPEFVPAYLAKMLDGIDTVRMTRAEAIQTANRRAESNYVRRQMSAMLRR